MSSLKAFVSILVLAATSSAHAKNVLHPQGMTCLIQLRQAHSLVRGAHLPIHFNVQGSIVQELNFETYSVNSRLECKLIASEKAKERQSQAGGPYFAGNAVGGVYDQSTMEYYVWEMAGEGRTGAVNAQGSTWGEGI